MSKGPGPMALLPLTLANALRRIGGKGKPKLVMEAARIKAKAEKPAPCGYCRPDAPCKHCRNFKKIQQRWADRIARKAERRAVREAAAPKAGAA